MSASDVADALGKNLAQGRSSGFSNTFLPMLGITALAVYAWQMRSKAKMLEERNRELALDAQGRARQRRAAPQAPGHAQRRQPRQQYRESRR